jgi:D-glycero-D-manno-heptose 1,7-bisphosphate phosphatase
MPGPGLGDIGTVFLDRDGTINVKPPEGEYVTSPDGLVLLPGAGRAVAWLNAAGIRTVLVTNQSWLSRSPENPARYAAIHARFAQLLAAEGARLDAAYHCPHAPAACDCRKPYPGMLRRAARDLRIELGQSAIIGDRDTDLMAGRAVGASAILVRAGEAGLAAVGADFVADDLPAAVSLILLARQASRSRRLAQGHVRLTAGQSLPHLDTSGRIDSTG